MIPFLYLHYKMHNPMKVIILACVLLAIAIVLLGVKVLFIKNGKFPSGHVKDIPVLRDKNIGCAHED